MKRSLGAPPWNEDSIVNKIITYKINNLSWIRKNNNLSRIRKNNNLSWIRKKNSLFSMHTFVEKEKREYEKPGFLFYIIFSVYFFYFCVFWAGWEVVWGLWAGFVFVYCS